MRIGLATVLIGDLLVRLSDLKAFYTDAGWLPLAVMHDGFYSDFSLSFHAMNGSYIWQIALISIGFCAALMMLVGYRTKVAIVVSWILLLSIQNRNVLILQGGDDFLRLALFWSMFMPLNNVWSFDSKAITLSRDQMQHQSAGVLGYVLLLFSVYFFSALMKSSSEWFPDGTALYYAFSLESMTYPLAKILFPYPEVLKYLTFGALAIELLAPLLLLIPYRTNSCRTIFFVLIIALQVGIGLCLQVGYFFIIAIAAMLGLTPKRCLDFIEFRIVKKTKLTTGIVEQKMVNGGTQGSKPIQSLAYLSMVISLLWNIGNLNKLPLVVKKTLAPIAQMTRLTQNWGMFAPTVYKADGWFVYKGYRKDGPPIDLLDKDLKLSFAKPDRPVKQYKNAKWRKLGENVIRDKNRKMRQPLCRYLLKTFNSKHGQMPIDKLEIFYLREMTLPNYQIAKSDTGRICSCALIY